MSGRRSRRLAWGLASRSAVCSCSGAGRHLVLATGDRTRHSRGAISHLGHRARVLERVGRSDRVAPSRATRSAGSSSRSGSAVRGLRHWPARTPTTGVEARTGPALLGKTAAVYAATCPGSRSILVPSHVPPAAVPRRPAAVAPLAAGRVVRAAAHRRRLRRRAAACRPLEDHPTARRTRSASTAPVLDALAGPLVAPAADRARRLGVRRSSSGSGARTGEQRQQIKWLAFAGAVAAASS